MPRIRSLYAEILRNPIHAVCREAILERFAAALNAGFKGFEYFGPFDHTREQIAELLQRNHLWQVLRGWSCLAAPP